MSDVRALFGAELRRLWARPLARRTLLVGTLVAALTALTSSPVPDAHDGSTIGDSLRSVVPLLSLALAAAAAGSWCSSGTERLLCLWTGARTRLFAVETLATALVATLLALLIFAEVSAAMMVRAALAGETPVAQLDPLTARPGALLLTCAAGGVLGASLGLLVRSSGPALGIVAGLYVVIEPMLVASASAAGFDAVIYTPVLGIAALASPPELGMPLGASPLASWVAVAVWTLMLVVLSAARMARRDLP